jgi:hypothetical protein
MKRFSRHTVVVLVVALLSCVGGMSLAVVAFGQAGGSQDGTVPLGDYTSTTPAQTAPVSGYTTPTPTAPAPTPRPVTAPSSTGQGQVLPTKTTGTSATHTNAGTSPASPSSATRPGPTHLAFTGGEPIVIGAAGVALMLAGLGLQLRRRRASSSSLA